MHEAEWLTRKQQIDNKLQALNPKWQTIPYPYESRPRKRQ
jgi:hypothetical protein